MGLENLVSMFLGGLIYVGFFLFFFAYSKQSEVTVILRNVIDETKYVCECLECFGMRFFFFVGMIFVQGFFVWFC